MIFICTANGGRGTAQAVFRVKETLGETVRGEENMLSWPPLITRCSSPRRGNEQLASTELAGSTPAPSTPPFYTAHLSPRVLPCFPFVGFHPRPLQAQISLDSLNILMILLAARHEIPATRVELIKVWQVIRHRSAQVWDEGGDAGAGNGKTGNNE